MTTAVPPLMEILAEIPDPRQASGKRYPLTAMLTLVCVAVMCGYRSVKAIAEWGANYGEAYREKLGFNEHGYPAQASWYRVLRMLDVEVVEQKLRGWMETVLVALSEGELVGLSIDGKTLRISQKMGAYNSHLLSAVAHRIGVVLGQWAVDEKTNEIGMMETVLLDLALEGRVVTTDALLTQQDVAATIVERGGDYVLPVKDNQPLTHEAIRDWFDYTPPYEFRNQTAQRVEKGHGRIMTRRIEVTTQLNDYLNWPGLAQAFKLTRRTVSTTTGELREETVYGITSLTPQQASPEDLLSCVQQHWTIENKLHWVKDVTLDEDRCQLRVGSLHQLMALFRNLALSLLRLDGHHNIASALRACAAQPPKALRLLTYPFGER